MTNYLSFGDRRAVILGRLTDLLGHIAAKKETGGYGRIHSIAYSLGSIVALDALFPPDAGPGRHFEPVHTLVTIGCPFDLIRNFWARYFENRSARPNIPQRWLNAYSPVDVLSSNFRDDPGPGEPQEGIDLRATDSPGPRPKNLVYAGGTAPESLSAWGLLALWGLCAHAQYWEPKFESELSCFGPIVREMYAAGAFLN